MGKIKTTIVHEIDNIDPKEWDSCASPESENGCKSFDPFTTHRFLSALEESKSVGGRSGWIPHHLVVKKKDKIVGVMPLYLKNNSQGEYIFDHNWAHAYMQAGGNYYPKFQVAVPFTPVTGRRLLTKPGLEDEIGTVLLETVKKIATDNMISSIHLTFCTSEESQLAPECKFVGRQSLQYHWLNNDYSDFDDFLFELSSRKRKQIKKERKAIHEYDGNIIQLTGKNITAEIWDYFWEFYQDTGARKWGSPYLTRSFFDIIHRTMRDDLLLVVAKRKEKYIAAALNFIGRDTLFGRYWGCVESHSYLHYELCYYQAIEYALTHGLKKVEAGAQGEHKLSRGYLPAITNSMHWFLNESFNQAIIDYVKEEKILIQKQFNQILDHSPFKKNNGQKHF